MRKKNKLQGSEPCFSFLIYNETFCVAGFPYPPIWKCSQSRGSAGNNIRKQITIMMTPKYIPALRYKWLTPLYDFLFYRSMPEKKIKKALIEASYISSKAKVFDFGCGTATLTIMVKELCPEAKVTGIDLDIEILDKAIQKVKEKELDIILLNYDGSHLPFQNKAFDRIPSSLVFHHLDKDAKRKALAEAFRVLGNNGELFKADFGRSKS